MSENSFENILEQITELLKYAQDNKSEILNPKEKPKPLDPNIERQLESVEQTMEMFRKITDEALKRSGLDEATIQSKTQVVPDELESKDKRIFQRAKNLRNELDVMEKEFAAWHTVAKLKKKKESTAGKKRIKKFKRLGGQGWTPL